MLKRAVLLTIVFLATLGLVAQASKSEIVPIRASFVTFPMDIDGWKGRQEPPFADDILAVLGVDDYLTRSYFSPQGAVGLYVGYWGSQSQGDTIHSPLNCLPGAGWEPLSKGTLQLDVADATGAARQVSINRYVIQKGLDRQLVLYWYQSHGRVVASEYAGKFYLVKDAIQLNRTDAAMVRVVVPIRADDTDGAEAERKGAMFVKSLFPVLNTYLPV
jgi:EpsI family protein